MRVSWPTLLLSLAFLCCGDEPEPARRPVRLDASDADHDGFAATAWGGTDCDDGNPSVSPGAEERCNGADDDCDGRADVGAFECTAGSERACEGGPWLAQSCGVDCRWGPCGSESFECPANAPCAPGETRPCEHACGPSTQRCGAACTWGECAVPSLDCDSASEECRFAERPPALDIPFELEWMGYPLGPIWATRAGSDLLLAFTELTDAAESDLAVVLVDPNGRTLVTTALPPPATDPIVSGNEAGAFLVWYAPMNGPTRVHFVDRDGMSEIGQLDGVWARFAVSTGDELWLLGGELTVVDRSGAIASSARLPASTGKAVWAERGESVVVVAGRGRLDWLDRAATVLQEVDLAIPLEVWITSALYTSGDLLTVAFADPSHIVVVHLSLDGEEIWRAETQNPATYGISGLAPWGDGWLLSTTARFRESPGGGWLLDSAGATVSPLRPWLAAGELELVPDPDPLLLWAEGRVQVAHVRCGP